MKKKLIKFHWILSSQFGIDPIRFIKAVVSFPRYIYEYLIFRKRYEGSISSKPCFHDRYEEAGNIRSEYFWQDLLVARWIHNENPIKHIDIGSRVDGFVAHVASFRDIDVIDIRAIETQIPGIRFIKADIMNEESIAVLIEKNGCYDSVSCLHAFEHFGLGRYGDPIDPVGYEKALKNMAMLLKPKGILYLSTPIGKEKVEFNANFVFDPRKIIKLAHFYGLSIEMLTIIQSKGYPQEILLDDNMLDSLSLEEYCLGIFKFRKG